MGFGLSWCFHLETEDFLVLNASSMVKALELLIYKLYPLLEISSVGRIFCLMKYQLIFEGLNHLFSLIF